MACQMYIGKIPGQLFVVLCLMLSNSCSFQVSIPPVISRAPDRRVLFIPGETLILSCEATGYPPPQYHWITPDTYKVEDKSTSDDILLGGASGTLTITDTTALIEGYYECCAQNSAGKDWARSFVQMAYLEPFPAATDETLYADLGSYLVLRCPQPESMPLPEISWFVTNANGSMVEYKTYNRVIKDFNGNLHFTSIVPEDSKETYACAAKNSIVRNMVVSQSQSVIIRSGGAQNGGISLQWHSDSDPIFYVGEIIKLQCIFSGSPTPYIRWGKLRLGLPQGRAYTEAWDTVLVVVDIQPEDSGQYECIAYSDSSDHPVTYTFNVHIQAPPEITAAPVSTNATEGATVVFQCIGSGDPEPFSSWYSNGQLLYTSTGTETLVNERGLTLVNDTHLVIADVTTASTMTISCSKSQGERYDNASAYLSVWPKHISVLGAGPPTVQTCWFLLFVTLVFTALRPGCSHI